MMTASLFRIAMLQGLLLCGGVVAQCSGCHLLGVAYSGFYLGQAQLPPDTYYSFTPNLLSADGACAWVVADCEHEDCVNAGGTFTIGYTGPGTVEIYDFPHQPGEEPRATLTSGQEVGLPVGSVMGAHPLDCGDMDDVLVWWLGDEEWTFAIRCTSCPGNS